jgi:hypothetical protein
VTDEGGHRDRRHRSPRGDQHEAPPDGEGAVAGGGRRGQRDPGRGEDAREEVGDEQDRGGGAQVPRAQGGDGQHHGDEREAEGDPEQGPRRPPAVGTPVGPEVDGDAAGQRRREHERRRTQDDGDGRGGRDDRHARPGGQG